MFPHADELKLDIRLKQATYRPGEQAVAELRVNGPESTGSAGALGVLVYDQAVEELARREVQAGSREEGLDAHLGFAAEIAGRGNSDSAGGVTLQDLMHLDLTKPVPKGYELAAKLLLNSKR